MCIRDSVTAAGGVGAAATTGEAQLGEAFLDDSVTGQIAALLFLEGDTGNVLQNGGAVNAGFLGDGITIKMCIRDRALPTLSVTVSTSTSRVLAPKRMAIRSPGFTS